ncbi:syntaxin-7 [Trichogramma pretiosum]|uniref:t-SNARE coiled-coil homology domain-containing protein n=1 Tax=Trichogramma kaykai TaxID=54128 RepID=A0ABD2XLX3_9HYME|nr:syntaxin-7 [Trichogramma pretiosum]XP_014229313.1 syntaxin-7 [Trichogramma pretiosum]XP_014229315.1 syntaxin-7 [Trichogramma pretiosum]XP_014229316.1 syntaxin-7 [Trichogramma pretiosum]XP_014229317.1 syntaxin-7 [Trichogramma pretiosum]
MAHSSHTYGSTDQRSDLPDVGFSPTELYSLSENITANIYTINSSYKTLSRSFKLIGTNKDNQAVRDRVHETQLSTNQLVTMTSKNIARLTVLMRQGDKQLKLQIEKLTSDFKDAVQRYSDMQKSIAERMKRHMLVVPSPETSEKNNPDDTQDLIQIQDEIKQRAEQRTLEFDHGLILEQEERIKQIEGDILDVNQVMRELGALVHQQADSINSIENNIENAHGHVELGAQELIKASNYQNKFRRKICILLVVAITFVIILILVIVLSKKSS